MSFAGNTGNRLRVVALVAVLCTSSMEAAHGGGEGSVYAGACTFTLDVTFTTPLGPLPGRTYAAFSGDGTCVVNTEIVDAHFSASLGPVFTTIGMGCTTGTLSGRGTFDTAALGFPDPGVAVEVVNVGGVILMDVHTGIVIYRGAGVFQQPQAHTDSCVNGAGLSSTTWTGAIAFEDPEPPV